MNEELENVESILYEALRLADAREREAYLEASCGTGTPLRANVDSLLRAYEDQAGVLRVPDGLLEELGESVSEGPGSVIGRYRLLERIGEGGMAVVYMAEQEEPLRRKVALKIIKLGMDTKQVIARFETERQALAMMDHPNIAKVLDAGATETGRPYFVMELVQGVSITEYCDKSKLSTRDRLALFIQVCQAVQHAHQKGIIHRDIKPSNVMVTQRDGKPIPKVIDFGIAKATNQKLTEKTLFTRYAHIIGTPAYMSPEQAKLSDVDIDTRSDIYSLGVLLYELLTGTTPFSEEELRQAGYVEMQRVIREEEPAKPSTKLSTLGETLANIAKHRGCTCDLLAKAVRGDLDWIVMKSLEKDRTRRYETANGLAMDVQRHLDNEPVLARGPSTTYHLHKFLRRHRSHTVAALIMMVFAGAATVVLSMWNRDRLQLAEAEGFRDRGVLSQAREQYTRADREAALETIHPILQSRDVGSEAQLLQAGILVDNRSPEEATVVLEGLLDGEPEIAGTAHSLLARILWESASPDAETLQEIEEHRRKAEALLPETAEAYFLRAMTSLNVKEQLAALDRALQLDPSHYESRRLRAFTFYASRKYDRLRDDALVMTVLRPPDPLGYSLRAIAWRELGRYPEAIADYDRAITLTPKQDPQYVELSKQRSETLLRMGDYERVIEGAPAGAKDASPLPYQVFCALTALGEYDKASALFREIIAPADRTRRAFRQWCMKYVFDTREAGRSWHLSGNEPAGPAFLPMLEAEETYRRLSAKAHRLTTDGFSACWSPDGSKLAFSAGVHGYSGVALFDPATKQTELLIVPGKDPRWSPDGKYIAFVRDCRFLRVSEFIALEPRDQRRLMADEEVWVIKSDGTEPRQLARGGSPSWSRDSTCVYYHSRLDKALCSISIEERNAEPKQIMKCWHEFPAISPDEKRVAYIEDARLKVKDLTSQTLIAEWPVLATMWGGVAWSPTGRELCLGGAADQIGLWIYSLGKAQPVRVLDGHIGTGLWSVDGTKLAVRLSSGYCEVWAADLDPNVPIIETLGPPKTTDEHFREMLAYYTRRIEADPNDAYAYASRAQCHDYLGDRASANADMRQWSAVAGGGQPSDLLSATGLDFRRVINLPFDCQLVFSAEGPVNTIPMISVALGQKGRCKMKLLEIPMFVTSLFGLGLLFSLDGPPVYADFTFGEPANLKTVIPPIDPAHESIGCFSYDGLEMYFYSDRPGGRGGYDLWAIRRASMSSDWGPPENLGPALNTSSNDLDPTISADGLTLYFSSKRSGGYDIYASTRTAEDALWSPPVNLPRTVNSPAREGAPWISPDGLELYFRSVRSGGYGDFDIYVARRATRNDTWGEAENLGPVVNGPHSENYFSLSPDGLLLLFSDQPMNTVPRPGGYGGSDMWMTRRASVSSAWQAPKNLGFCVNSPVHEIYPRLSPDGSMLYFATMDSAGTFENWQASVEPICDFNGDGKVDGKDLLVMIVGFGGTDALCDIGPYVWGDGVVDFEDLKVLAEYIGKEVVDGMLIAHWKLDETEGTVAADSAGESDGTVMGFPAWQPEGGKVDGALKFDGVDDFVVADSPVGLGDGPFSILAWVKGGAADEVILSSGTTDWLYTNPADGSLMTALSSVAGNGQPLFSDVVITDGRWHRIGLVWDGVDRILLVDEQEVTRDEQAELAIPNASLMIGTGVTPNRFFSGQIDEVRIYNRAVRP